MSNPDPLTVFLDRYLEAAAKLLAKEERDLDSLLQQRFATTNVEDYNVFDVQVRQKQARIDGINAILQLIKEILREDG